jgi:hypothetical protein
MPALTRWIDAAIPANPPPITVTSISFMAVCRPFQRYRVLSAVAFILATGADQGQAP